MRRPIEEPVTIEETRSADKTTVTKHPAFGQIVAYRVTGGATSLYGSDFEHNGYIAVEISHSELNRNLSRDWHFARGQVVRLAMSEAQWATFVSSFGVGGGVPCTLEYIGNEPVPMLPPRASWKLYAEEAGEQFKDTIAELQAIRATVAEKMAKVPNKVRAEIAGPIDRAISLVASSLPFVKKSFDEHVETSIEAAKLELNAYMTGALQRAGLDALRGEMPLQLAAPAAEAPSTDGQVYAAVSAASEPGDAPAAGDGAPEWIGLSPLRIGAAARLKDAVGWYGQIVAEFKGLRDEPMFVLERRTRQHVPLYYIRPADGLVVRQ